MKKKIINPTFKGRDTKRPRSIGAVASTYAYSLELNEAVKGVDWVYNSIKDKKYPQEWSIEPHTLFFTRKDDDSVNPFYNENSYFVNAIGFKKRQFTLNKATKEVTIEDIVFTDLVLSIIEKRNIQ